MLYFARNAPPDFSYITVFSTSYFAPEHLDLQIQRIRCRSHEAWVAQHSGLWRGQILNAGHLRGTFWAHWSICSRVTVHRIYDGWISSHALSNEFIWAACWVRMTKNNAFITDSRVYTVQQAVINVLFIPLHLFVKKQSLSYNVEWLKWYFAGADNTGIGWSPVSHHI